MKVAIFDFDGTLYSKETFYTMMDHLKDHPLYKQGFPKFMRQIFPLYIANKIKLYPTIKMRSRSMQLYLQALHGLTVEETDVFFTQLAIKMRNDLNEEVVDKVIAHSEEGLQVMLVSGAFTPLLHAVCAHLPFAHIIGTDIPTMEGKLNAKIPIVHVQGMKKNEKIQQYFHKEKIDWKNSYAYGDSYSDLSVLSLVGHPIAVHPDDKLHAMAKRRNWDIL